LETQARVRKSSVIMTTFEELDDLLNWAFDDWNGRKAKAITKETIQLAKDYFLTLPKSDNPIDIPDVSAMQDGSICFMWVNRINGDSIELSEVKPDGRVLNASSYDKKFSQI